MGGSSSKKEKVETVFFENEAEATTALAVMAGDGDNNGDVAEAYSAAASEDEAGEPEPRVPTPPPVVAQPLPASENKFAKRFKERSGSFKKGAEGDGKAQAALNNADGANGKLPTKITPKVALSVDRGEVKRRFSHNDASQYPKIAAAVESGEMTEEQAATKIQALFKGNAARKEMEEQAQAATKIQAVFKGNAARKEMEEQAQAAVKIQAVFRGSKLRKDMAQATTEPEQIGDGLAGATE